MQQLANTAPNPYIEAERRYQGYRDAAMHLAWEKWHNDPRLRGADLKLMPFNNDALKLWRVLWPVFEVPNGEEGFPWDEIYRWSKATPRRFDLALWDGPILCGLVAGMASKGKTGPDTSVKIRFVERLGKSPNAPHVNAIRGFVAAIALDVAYAYAQQLSKKWLYVKNPRQNAVARYEGLGFKLVKQHKGNYFYGKPVEIK